MSEIETARNSKIFVAIAGNIGAGKTTLSQLLSERFSWKAHFESVSDNPYLSDFYRDMNRWAFPLQIYFLNNRYRAHQKVLTGNDSAIQDRSIYEDAHIFARNLYEHGYMEERDYVNYLDLYRVMTSMLQPPDLVIYLRKSLPKLKERIAMRGRDYEKAIPEEYLTALNRYYDDWMETYDLGKKLILDSDDLDLVNDRRQFDDVTHRVLQMLDQKDLFLS